MELNLFNKIFNEYKNENEFKNDIEQIHKTFIYNMKKIKTDEQVGLFFLSYLNLSNIFGINDI